LGRTNFVTIKARIDTHISERVGGKPRDKLTQAELDHAESELDAIRGAIEKEFFDV
jgi:hypothetical protein